MVPNAQPKPSRTELRRQQSLERRQQLAIDVAGGSDASVPLRAPHLSFAAEVLQRALPREIIDRGLIRFDPTGQPRVAHYDPSLVAPNPQRGRVVDRNLDRLAESLNTFGQQETIVARLITEADRQHWPDAFNERQLVLILKGHRIYFAQPRSRLKTLRVELMLPNEGEDDIAYSRRSLLRASIKMMHSQAYDIFDKVNQFDIWKQEFGIERPKDQEIAAYFEISRTEAQRLKVVSQLDPQVAQEIINSDRRPGDEVVFAIANRPAEEHREAFKQFGHLTVAAVRKLVKEEEGGTAVSNVNGAGRPRNYVLAVRDEESHIAYVSTSLTPDQWRRRGGAKAFWQAIRELAHCRELQDRLMDELG